MSKEVTEDSKEENQERIPIKRRTKTHLKTPSSRLHYRLWKCDPWIHSGLL